MKRAGRESLITIDAWEKRLQACGLVLLGCLLFAAGGAAQGNEGVKKPLTLEDAVNYALQHYPAVRASLEQVNAAEAKVALTRTQYLPQLNGVYAISRATQNQVEGVWLPTPITPTVEGPQGPSSSASYWGSQAAALFSWEPLDFGLRSARVGEARAGEEKSRAELALTRLQVATAVGRYFFLAMANQEASKAAQANVDRWEVFARSTHVLVDNELRPGADASRANAELARAKTQLYQAQEGEREALDTLAALMGTAGTEIQLDGSALLDMPVNEELPEGTAADHPIVREQMASVKVAQAQERTVDKSNYPRLFLQGEGFARGSGVESNGAYVGNWNGAAPARGNWVTGITILFPDVFGFKARSAQEQITRADEQTQQAHYDETIQQVTGQMRAARDQLKGAELVARQTPSELQAARQTETQSRARYQSGLATVVEVAEAENLLAQAETDDAVARLNVWRGLFGVAYAQGDLQNFLQALRGASTGGH